MEISLRKKEKQIEQDMFNQVFPRGGNLTVLELVDYQRFYQNCRQKYAKICQDLRILSKSKK